VLSDTFLLKNHHSKPIIRQPDGLTTCIFQGKPLLITFMPSETKYLDVPSMKLLAPTAIFFLSGSISPNLSALSYMMLIEIVSA
jgi:hypothetical protein